MLQEVQKGKALQEVPGLIGLFSWAGQVFLPSSPDGTPIPTNQWVAPTGTAISAAGFDRGCLCKPVAG